jgi:hypothetical protein
MRRTTMAVAAATCSGLLGLGLIAAPAAMAYPPGKEEKTVVNKTEVRSGGKVKAQARNAQPGCRVTFSVVNRNGKTVSTRTAEVNSEGRANQTVRMPEKPGNYEIVTRVFGRGCEEASSSASVRVG